MFTPTSIARLVPKPVIRPAHALLSIALLAGMATGCKPQRSAATSSGAAADEDTQVATAATPQAATVVPVSLPKEITFNEHIQPILSEYCYHCHGPDSGTRKPKDSPLRLDREADAFAKRENGQPVIIKGDPAASLLVKLIKSHDPKEIMPPPEGHKELKPQEIALLEEWIRQGAKYEPHWSFAAIKHPEPPKAGEGFANNPIDRFIAQKLDENGLKPNPPEDPRRFYRRLAFDLTGLPPASADTDAFVKRSAEDPKKAVEEAADKLLATPSSAEHFTRQWLDAARYADTHGIHIDNYRSIWPYRDWVIRAFQANMPWDQFTTEQIAGDLLPDATLDQKVATGFNRCLATTGEGGAIAEEYDAIYAKDRTETTSAVWLGLTTGCAACHDHKFDPVSTKEFYSMTAFFRNTTMSALDGNKADHAPSIFVPLQEDRNRSTELVTTIKSVQQQIAAREKAATGDFEKWAANPELGATKDIDSSLVIHLPLNEESGPIKGIVDGQSREWNANPQRIDGLVGKGVVVSDSPIDLGNVGSFSRSDRVTYGGFIRIEGTPTGAIVARMNPAQSFRGWDIYLQGGKPAGHVIDSWDKAANKLTGDTVLSPGTWHHVMITFDGSSSGHQASALFVDGKLDTSTPVPNTVGGTIETEVPLRLGSRANNDSKLRGGKVALQDFRFYRRLLSGEEIRDLANNSILRSIVSVPPDQRTKEQKEQLFRYFVNNVDAPSRDLRTTLDKLTSEQSQIRSRGAATLVMEEKKNSAPFAHVLTRGVYSDKGEKVDANVPAVLPPLPPGAPQNRLGLAQWLVDPANPLPARVTMNRAWYYFFGTGIVETTEDFGIMGARPSHPQLLDWLASEFIASKWDYRHMVKLFVTSAAYRQSEAVTPEKLEKDPLNRLLSRGPRVRLDAEQLRDLALAASGLLTDKVGGPSVKPYQPDGIWESVAMPQSNTRNYKQDSGEALYRRSTLHLLETQRGTAVHGALQCPHP
ncbi:MAG: DUF1549 domain-containing protein [Luteolibacter sp.]